MGLGRGGGDGDIAVDEGICEGAQEREIGAFSVGELMLRSCDFFFFFFFVCQWEKPVDSLCSGNIGR